MKQSPSSDAYGSLDIQEIPSALWHPKVRHRVRMSRPLVGAKLNQSKCTHLIPLQSILRLSSHRRLSLEVVFFPKVQERTKRGGGAAGIQPHPQIGMKKTGIVETMISNILRNLPFSQNQPRKSADD